MYDSYIYIYIYIHTYILCIGVVAACLTRPAQETPEGAS